MVNFKLNAKNFRDAESMAAAYLAAYFGNNEIAFYNGASPSRVYIKDTNYSDTTSYKSWLSSNNVIADYIRANPEYLPITGTLAEQLEYIYNQMLSYQGQTNISQESNDLPFIISATTLKDISSLQEVII